MNRTGETERRGRSLAALALVGALLAGGCGDLTSGGFGDLEVVVAADSVPLAAAGAGLSPRELEAGAATQASTQAPPEGLAGTLDMSVQVYVLHPPARWVEVTDGVEHVSIPLDGSETEVLAEASVPAGRYRAVRTVFRRVEAFVERGLVVDGEVVTGTVRVRLGTGDVLVVDDPLEVEVPLGGQATLLVDVHAERWLRLLDRNLRQVDAQDFQGQLRLRQRP